ncbi:MAG: hypothetical protein ACK5OC_11195 [Pirellula sp.]|jgi:hypothetical protein
MIPNPITEEIRAIRHGLAAELGNDVFRIGLDLRRRQAESGRRIVKLPPRSPEPNTTNKPLQPSGGSGVSTMDTSTPAAG